MGQAEAKQQLQAIIDSIGRIRRDIKSGKLTANDIVRVEEILQRYLLELEGVLSKRLPASEIYNTEQLIETTKRELNLLGRESNLDLAAVPTNSFIRTSSKKYSKDKGRPVNDILSVVDGVKTRMRSDRLKSSDYDDLLRVLANCSQELSTSGRKNKKQDVDAAQKVISGLTAEVFAKQQKERQVSKPAAQKEAPKELKPEAAKLTSRNSGNLAEIEGKFDTLKRDVKTAETNKDRNRLRFLSKSVQTLMTDLQMINVQGRTVDEGRKSEIEKSLIRTHHHIDKIKRQINTESNINYLSQLQKKEEIAKVFEDIETEIASVNSQLNYQNYDVQKGKLNDCLRKLEKIDDVSQEDTAKKDQILEAINNIDTVIGSIEAEDKVNQVEWQHYQNKPDLQKITKEGRKTSQDFLQKLLKQLTNVSTTNEKVLEKKNYVLYNIQNNLRALDTHNEVVLRSPLKNLLLDNLVEFKENFGAMPKEEVAKIVQVLIETGQYVDGLVNPKNASENSTPQLVKIKTKEVPLASTITGQRSKLEQIQREVQNLQKQIEDARFVKDSQLYDAIKDKLLLFKSEVLGVLQREGESKFGENLVRYIDNVFAILENNIITRKSTTTEDILMDIMSVSTRVADLGNKIQGFNSTIQDYGSIKSSLLEHQGYLEKLKIASNRGNLLKARQDTVLQIKKYLEELESLQLDSGETSEQVKRFNQELRRLKEKVSRYSGTYRNVLYKTIEGDLNKCLKNVDKVFPEHSFALTVKQDIERCKMILEQKSVKDQNSQDPARHQQLQELQKVVSTVGLELDDDKNWTQNQLDQLDARLTLAVVTLDNFNDKRYQADIEKLNSEIHYNFSRLQEISLKMRPKTLTHPVLINQFEQAQAIADIISAIRNQLEIVKPQITSFIGVETSQKFLELDEVLVRATLKLDDLTIPQTSDMFKTKVALMTEIHNYSDILDERVKQSEEIERLEKEVKVMFMKIDSFNGYIGDPEYSSLDEEIIKLKIDLGKIKVNVDLQDRKEECIIEVDNCMKKLNESAKSGDSVIGTLV